MEPRTFPKRETERESRWRAVRMRRAIASDDIRHLAELFMQCSDLEVRGAGQMLAAIADGLLCRGKNEH